MSQIRYIFGISLLEDGSHEIMQVNSGISEDVVFRQMRAHVQMLDDDYSQSYRKRNRK